ncbi:kinase-like domain-containing protein [Flammula alnicola]|nr:kinase-like domain-containing protein [Flammula alnicola]
MSKRPSVGPSPPSHPPLGTLIDGNTLELVEVLGVGGYGVVYRAIEAFSNSQRSYAVKCLISAHGQSSSRRQLHLREITLHQISSAHPSVITLHRIVEDLNYTFIIMDYAPDDDLFTQILHKCRYLGDDALIKHVFLQVLDAVQYCHSLGIYHRDLKPENILCFDRGYRVAITDFGLATTDKLSKEFRTGSVYHMSPECQAGDSDSPTPYSPMHNDIWSLGIILLNLVTGRNPWKSAMPDDPTYKAYQRDSLHFLPSVLPISDEFNNLLVQTLDINWKERLSLDELRESVDGISTFYSDSVIFEGSLARCPWEAGLDLGNGANQPPADKRPVPNIPEGVEPYCVFSMSAAASEYKSQASVNDFADRQPWEGERARYGERHEDMDMYDVELHAPYESSGRSSYTSDSSLPATPSSFAATDCGFDVDSMYDRQRYYSADSTIFPSFGGTSIADTDDNRFASSVFLATPVVESKPFFHRPDTAYMDGYQTQKRYSSPNTSMYSVAEAELRSHFSDDEDDDYEDDDYEYDEAESIGEFPPSSPNFVGWPEIQTVPRTGSRPIDIPTQGRRDADHPSMAKPQRTSIFNPLRFFPRSSGVSWLNPKPSPPSSHPLASSGVAARMRAASPPPVPMMPWNEYHPHPRPRPVANVGNAGHFTGRGHGAQIRSNRDWIPG